MCIPKIRCFIYTFKLPVLNYFYNWLIVVIVLSLGLTCIVYVLNKGIHISSMKVIFSNPARIHLTVLVAVVLFLKSYGYKLQEYKLLFSGSGIVFGATYTDVPADRDEQPA